jgi:DNA-directed RNA polymerase specialized sigma24 family protein
MTNPVKNSFDDLLMKLEPEITTSGDRYRRMRHKLTKFFAWRRCEDPEALADETVSRFLKNVNGDQEITCSNPYSYVYAIATNVFREHLRDEKRQLDIAKEWRPPLSTPPPTFEDEVEDCRRRCLESLHPEKLKLLVLYYLGDAKREELARAKNLPLSTLRVHVHRVKNDLRACHKACVEKLGGIRN